MLLISRASYLHTSVRCSVAVLVHSVAALGDPEDIYKTDAKVKELIPDDEHLHHWLDMARERISFQGLPARIWVGFYVQNLVWHLMKWFVAVNCLHRS